MRGLQETHDLNEALRLPDMHSVAALQEECFGPAETRGWRVRLRHRYGYVSVQAWYQAVLNQMVHDGCMWLDVGGGKSIFPNNPKLSRALADRCGRLVAVDPSDNVHQNPFAHEVFQGFIEDFSSETQFDLATMRMVAEHIEDPPRALRALAKLVRPGGHVLVFTPNKWSLSCIAASVIPNRWHGPFARLLSPGRLDEDIFPTVYRMNTRRTLKALFRNAGFEEDLFAYLDDCVLLARWRLLHRAELTVWKMLHRLRLRYPETNLLGVYRRLKP